MDAEPHGRDGRDIGAPEGSATRELTVREVLALPVIRAGLPEVVAGADALGNRVRWVHTFDLGSGAKRLLRGRDLVLTTGVGWPGDDEHQTAYVDELVRAGAAGIVLELGRRFRHAPRAVVHACRGLGLPFVVLHRETAFIEVTEAAHRQILARHVEALDARGTVHTVFSTLALQGSPPDFMVSQVSRMLRCPVVLEDLGHAVVSYAQRDLTGHELLHDWERRSRLATAKPLFTGAPVERTAVLGPEHWLVTPVAARGRHWGRLVALPGPEHPAGRALVLEQAAVALSLSRAADPAERHWSRLIDRRLFSSLVEGRWVQTADLRAEWEAAGVPVGDATLLPCVVAVFGTDHGQVSADEQLLDAAVTAMASAGHAAHGTVTAEPGHPAVLLLVAAAPGRAPAPAPFAGLPAVLARGLPAGYGVRLVSGAPCDDLDQLADSVRDALTAARGLGPFGTQPEDATGQPLRAQGHRLGTLMRQIGTTPPIRDFVERSLGPVLDHDTRAGTDLAATLRAYLNHPGNRSRAASEVGVARSVFYQRLATIQQLLGVDLGNGETVAGLQAAFLAHDVLGREP